MAEGGYLDEGLAAANAELEQAGVSSSAVSEMQKATREAAEAFSDDLVAFRTALRAVIGSAHPDYRKLRVDSRGKAEIEDAEEKIE